MNSRLAALLISLLYGVPCASADWDFSSLLARTCSLDRLYEDPAHRAAMASSYDRQLMNRDASGYIGKENGRFLMADIKGPGAVVRIWSANPEGRMWIYLDDEKDPLIEADFGELFRGKVQPFLEPFVCVQHKEGAHRYHWSYVPIPFAKSCRIYLEKVVFFQANYVQFATETKVQSLTLPLAQRHREAIERLAPQFAAFGAAPLSVRGETRKLEGLIKPGRAARLASLKGPAVIRAFRLDWPDLDPQTGRTALLTMTWDGEKTPSVRAPPFDFFGSNFKTLLLGAEEKQMAYSYFPMPFRKSAEITLVNEGPEPLKFSGDVVVEEGVTLASPLRTFHAMWRRDLETRCAPTHDQRDFNKTVCDPQYNYLVADLKGRGHYVATMLHRTGRSEGDEFVFVDGEPPPGSSPGTGNEDYFNMAWGPQPMDGPLAGGQHAMDTVGCLRLHVSDPITFEKSLRFTFEVLYGNDARYDYDSTAYWYQEEPHSAFLALLPAPARRFRTLPAPPDCAYIYTPDPQMSGWWNGQPVLPFEGEALEVVRFEGPRPAPVDMLTEGPDWSGGQQLLQRGAGAGASFTVKLPPVDSDGWHRLAVRWITGPEYGRFRLHSNRASELREVDCYAPTRGAKLVWAGAVQRARGDDAELTVDAVGHGKAAKSAWAGIDWLILEPTAGPITNLLLKPAGSPDAKWEPCPRLPPPSPQERAEAQARRRTPPPAVAFEPAAGSNGVQPFLFRAVVEVPGDGLYRLEYRVGGASVPPSITVNGVDVAMDPRRFATPALPEEKPPRFYLPLKAGQNELTWRAALNRRQWIAPALMGSAPPRESSD
jgi:hypothetical protein